MKIILNGDTKEYDNVETISQLMERQFEQRDDIIVVLNGTILKKRLWNERQLKDGDDVRLVQFVGGG
ncbi:MAG: sulfur carrier protein ThiS [bacterium]|nr:sulfur carrier protein ThiS [bacterium]